MCSCRLAQILQASAWSLCGSQHSAQCQAPGECLAHQTIFRRQGQQNAPVWRRGDMELTDTQNWNSTNTASDLNQRLMIYFCPVNIFACLKFWGSSVNFRIVSICHHYFKESLPILPRALHCHSALAMFPPCHSSETIWFSMWNNAQAEHQGRGAQGTGSRFSGSNLKQESSSSFLQMKGSRVPI